MTTHQEWNYDINIFSLLFFFLQKIVFYFSPFLFISSTFNPSCLFVSYKYISFHKKNFLKYSYRLDSALFHLVVVNFYQDFCVFGLQHLAKKRTTICFDDDHLFSWTRVSRPRGLQLTPRALRFFFSISNMHILHERKGRKLQASQLNSFLASQSQSSSSRSCQCRI